MKICVIRQYRWIKTLYLLIIITKIPITIKLFINQMIDCFSIKRGGIKIKTYPFSHKLLSSKILFPTDKQQIT